MTPTMAQPLSIRTARVRHDAGLGPEEVLLREVHAAEDQTVRIVMKITLTFCNRAIITGYASTR